MKMMTDEQLNIICDRARAGCVYWDDSIRLVAEIRRLRQELEDLGDELSASKLTGISFCKENMKLKCELSVFTENMPHKNEILGCVEEWSDYCADSHNEDVPHFYIVMDWLKRIADASKK